MVISLESVELSVEFRFPALVGPCLAVPRGFFPSCGVSLLPKSLSLSLLNLMSILYRLGSKLCAPEMRGLLKVSRPFVKLHPFC